jgi:glucosamine-6-phosphate deaminase
MEDICEVNPPKVFKVNKASVRIFASRSLSGKAAAADAAHLMRNALLRQRHVRIVVATGNSQADLINTLTKEEVLDWSLVEVFHMDEYVGMSSSHPSSFARWLKTRVTDVVHPGKVHYLRGDSLDVDAELRRYAALLTADKIDLCLLGFGENGHIAFNDPHAADFNDPLVVRRVTLDERCCAQQVGEGHFDNLEAVPKEAITLTCPTLMSARNVICCVPDRRKAEAVHNALQGPLSEKCPASLVRTHPGATIYLDSSSASRLTLSELHTNENNAS